jgi:glycosyltransferase involved in cell wall biosynthesis
VFVSVVIPTYNESNIYETLIELAKQTIFTKFPKNIEIIIADYDPERNNIVGKQCLEAKFTGILPPGSLRTVTVDRKGIAYARHQGILHSTGEIIVNFDADAKFTTLDGIEKLIYPITDLGAVCTCCDNYFDASQFEEDLASKITAVATYEGLNAIQKDAMIVTLEPGFTFSREAYDYSGGFFDVRQAEAIMFSPKLIYNYGLFAKRHVTDTAIMVSPRRINAMNKYGLLGILNYDNAFRFNKLLNIV